MGNCSLPKHVAYILFNIYVVLLIAKIIFVFMFLGAFAKLRKVTISFVMSVCPSVRPSALNNFVSTGRISLTFDI
jgi:hypothetical protein